MTKKEAWHEAVERMKEALRLAQAAEEASDEHTPKIVVTTQQANSQSTTITVALILNPIITIATICVAKWMGLLP